MSTADVWLTALRFSPDGLMGFSGRSDLLGGFPRIAGYRDVVQKDAALGRVWTEMQDGLVAFMKQRTAAPT